MFRVRRDPFWIVYIFGPIVVILFFLDPARRDVYEILLVATGFVLLLRFIFWIYKKITGSPVPDDAVREMIKRCTDDNSDEEWVLVKFRPSVSLAEARYKVGSQTYSEKDRLKGFIAKLAFISESRPDAAIFYSKEKGFLLGNREVIIALEKKHGAWILDTWYSLLGAMRGTGMTAVNLDGPQYIIGG
jgi:hypothetical protein